MAEKTQDEICLLRRTVNGDIISVRGQIKSSHSALRVKERLLQAVIQISMDQIERTEAEKDLRIVRDALQVVQSSKKEGEVYLASIGIPQDTYLRIRHLAEKVWNTMPADTRPRSVLDLLDKIFRDVSRGKEVIPDHFRQHQYRSPIDEHKAISRRISESTGKLALVELAKLVGAASSSSSG